jgi:hypothetical protein
MTMDHGKKKEVEKHFEGHSALLFRKKTLDKIFNYQLRYLQKCLRRPGALLKNRPWTPQNFLLFILSPFLQVPQLLIVNC